MITVLGWPLGTPDDLNPYVRLMYRRFVPPDVALLAYRPLMRRVPEADLFHIQWAEGIFEGRGGTIPFVALAKALRVLATADAVRRRGGAVVLTAHNLMPHGTLSAWQRRLYAWYVDALLGRVDLIIALTARGLTLFRDHYPRAAPIAAEVIPHPHYRESYVSTISRPDARAAFRLAPAATVIGIIGSIRASKGIPDAISIFRRVAHADEMLLVAGECVDEALWRQVQDVAAQDPRIVIRRGRLSDAEVAAAFAAIDICLIHQQGTLNSGTAMMALSMDTPVVAPAVGSLPELARTVGGQWMALAAIDADDAEYRAAFDATATARGRHCDALDAFAPDELSQRMLESFIYLARRTL